MIWSSGASSASRMMSRNAVDLGARDVALDGDGDVAAGERLEPRPAERPEAPSGDPAVGVGEVAERQGHAP